MQTEKTVEGIKALVAFFENPNLENSELVVKIEQEADDLQYHLIEELNESFVTPIDREDIFRLSRAIDDMIDYTAGIRDRPVWQPIPDGIRARFHAALPRQAPHPGRALPALY